MKNPGIYILTSPSGKQYVGKDTNLPKRVKAHLNGNTPQCRAIHNAIQKYGRDAFSVEIIRYPGISEKALNAVERWWIRRLKTLDPGGYNLTEGGDSSKRSKETCQKISKKISEHVKQGTHNLLGDRNPSHKRIANGTHNFLGGEIPRRAQKKRVKAGTHPFLDSEYQRSIHKKRLEDGTHHLLGNNHWKRKKRQKAEWCYVIAVSRFYYEIHEYTLKRRAEFLSKDIPDTSNAEQEYLF